MVGVLRTELRVKLRAERLMGYFRNTRDWGVEADKWLGEEVVAGRVLHQRVSTVRMMFSMWLTEDVVANTNALGHYQSGHLNS